MVYTNVKITLQHILDYGINFSLVFDNTSQWLSQYQTVFVNHMAKGVFMEHRKFAEVQKICR
jgi:hypothetical protein